MGIILDLAFIDGALSRARYEDLRNAYPMPSLMEGAQNAWPAMNREMQRLAMNSPAGQFWAGRLACQRPMPVTLAAVPEATRLPEARGDLWRIVCWLLGHRWHIVSANGRKASALVHLHTMAGSAAACDRCGELWDDR